MRYFGGKSRQAPALVEAIKRDFGVPSIWAESFCGGLGSAEKAMREFPKSKFLLNDIDPFLYTMWTCVLDGWTPPETVTFDDHADLKTRMSKDDPMTAYVGYGWSFGGRFFGTFVPAQDGRRGGYPGVTRKKLLLTNRDVVFSSLDYKEFKPSSSVYYLDPPYQTSERRWFTTGGVELENLIKYGESLPSSRVYLSEFGNPTNLPVLHSWGNTTRMFNNTAGKPVDEVLVRIK